MVESELWVSLASKPLGIGKINWITNTYGALCFKYSIEHPPHTHTHTHTGARAHTCNTVESMMIYTASSFYCSKLKALVCQSLIFSPLVRFCTAIFGILFFAWHRSNLISNFLCHCSCVCMLCVQPVCSTALRCPIPELICRPLGFHILTDSSSCLSANRNA